MYYGTQSLLPVAGSQAAIQALPGLRAPGRVGVLQPGYAEHARAWRRAGHAVSLIAAEQLHNAVPRLDVLVLANPNNPSGARFPRRQLCDWHASLAARGGELVVVVGPPAAPAVVALAATGPVPHRDDVRVTGVDAAPDGGFDAGDGIVHGGEQLDPAVPVQSVGVGDES